jgi:hypothetical protein
MLLRDIVLFILKLETVLSFRETRLDALPKDLALRILRNGSSEIETTKLDISKELQPLSLIVETVRKG